MRQIHKALPALEPVRGCDAEADQRGIQANDSLLIVLPSGVYRRHQEDRRKDKGRDRENEPSIRPSLALPNLSQEFRYFVPHSPLEGAGGWRISGGLGSGPFLWLDHSLIQSHRVKDLPEVFFALGTDDPGYQRCEFAFSQARSSWMQRSQRNVRSCLSECGPTVQPPRTMEFALGKRVFRASR